MARTAVEPGEITTREQFANGLTALRLRAGLTVRDVAKHLDVPSGTLGDYFSGRHLPSASQIPLVRALLGACGVRDDADVEQWIQALTRIRVSHDGRSSRAKSPYLGLRPFQPDDAELFFGREEATAAVIDRLRLLRDDPEPTAGILAVVGPSGSGKSSLVRAGVVPRIDNGALDLGTARWRGVVVTPGLEPLETISAVLNDAAVGPRVLVIDQFEELFTSASKDERSSVISALANCDPSRVLVIVTLRADFYEAAARESVLLAVLRQAQILLGPMTREQVRRAIVEPARRVGVVVDDTLLDLVLSDLAPRDLTDYAYAPGVLPLLSHALLATWEHAQRNQLTVASYQAVGGLRGAVRQSAERLFAALLPDQQVLTRRVLLRLVNVENAPFSRRRVRREELDELGADAATQSDIDAIIERFVAARLLTVDAGTVQVSHEALLFAWPRLREWLDDDQAGLAIHRRLTDAANAWQEADRDDALLLRGGPLQAASGWADDHRLMLNRAEQEFLDLSLRHEEAQRAAERRRTRRLKQVAAVLVVLTLVATGATIYAFDARATAVSARNQALSREVSIEADRLRVADPNLAMQLSLAAYRIAPTVEARSALLDSSAGEMPTRLIGPPGATALAINRAGTILAVTHADDASIHLFSLGSRVPTALAVVPGADATALFALAFSPDGRYLAAGDGGGHVRLWDLNDPRKPRLAATLGGFKNAVQAVSYSSDGTRLAAAGDVVRQWQIDDPAHPKPVSLSAALGVTAFFGVAYSADGKWLAASGQGGSLVVWPRDSSGPQAPRVEKQGSTDLTAVAFAPDSSYLATTGKDGAVRIWSLAPDGAPTQTRELSGFTSWANALAFSPDGEAIAAGSSDNTLRLWDTTTWTPESTFTHPGPVTGIAFEPGGHAVASADEDGIARLWTLPAPKISGTGGNVFSLAYSADSHRLFTVTSGANGGASIWNIADPRAPSSIDDVDMPDGFGPARGAGALAADRHLLAVANSQANVELFDVQNPKTPKPISLLTGAAPLVEGITFDHTGTLLAVGDDQAGIHLWDVKDPTHPEALPSLNGPKSIVLGLAFSPDGQLLAAASADNNVWLWDVSDPSRPRRLAVLSGFSNYAYTVAFTPDGHTLVAGSADHTIRMWDVSTPEKPTQIGGPLTGPNNYVYAIALSPDGTRLVAASTDGSVWMWNIANPAKPKLLATLHAASQPEFVVAYAPDGTSFAASGADQTIQFWDPDPEAAAKEICDAAGDSVTRAEWKQYVPGASYKPPCQ